MKEILLCCIFVALAGCEDRQIEVADDAAASNDMRNNGSADTSVDIAADSNGDGKSDDAAIDAAVAKPDMSSPIDLGGFTFNDGGCLTLASAKQICGSESDGSVCKLVVSCGISADTDTCVFRCEDGAATEACYDEPAVQCLLEAIASQSCDALKACYWVL